MKKYLITLAVIMLVGVMPNSVYAGSLTAVPGEVQKETQQNVDEDETESDREEEFEDELESVEFEITDGITRSKKTESTFDDSRTISGVAEKGTLIVISVSTRNAEGDLEENACYDMEVGASGLFSQAIELEIGENVVEITASKDERETVSKKAVIKRKKREIKKELENTICIPGDTKESVFLIK